MPPALFILVACSSTPTAPRDAMAGICQFKPCVCSQSSGSILAANKTTAVLYGERGEALCPAGFDLRFADPKQTWIERYGN